jgi:hypothetical protein
MSFPIKDHLINNQKLFWSYPIFLKMINCWDFRFFFLTKPLYHVVADIDLMYGSPFAELIHFLYCSCYSWCWICNTSLFPELITWRRLCLYYCRCWCWLCITILFSRNDHKLFSLLFLLFSMLIYLCRNLFPRNDYLTNINYFSRCYYCCWC